MKTVTVYTTSNCPFCVLLKNFLKAKDIPFKEVNVENNAIAMKELINNTGYMAVPQTEIDGEWINGFDMDLLEDMLQR